jgi:pimeloyl-ACP methyl ester carboxylesterase
MDSAVAPQLPAAPTFVARVAARARAAALIPIVMDLPGLAPAARRLTPEPTVEQVDVAGVPVSVTSPAGPGAYPAWVFVTGAHPLRRKEPVVQRLAEGLARSRYVALVPDLPGLGEGQLTHDTLEAAVAVIEAALRRPNVRGRIALVGASAGASIALLAGARESICDRISVVVSIAPFADLRKILCLATTSRYAEGAAFAEYPVATLLRRAVGRSVAAALPPSAERERLLTLLGTIDDEKDPFEGLDAESELPDTVTAPLVRLLANRDPDRFDELYVALPADVRTAIEQLSPLAVAARVAAPVELAVPPQDPYFPFGEAQTLAEALPNVRLTVTSTLDHTRPMASLGRLGGLRKFEAFVVRGLAAAAA